MSEIRVKSENLLDDENYAGEGYLSAAGDIIPLLNYVVSELIPVTGGVSLSFTNSVYPDITNTSMRIAFYDSDKNFIASSWRERSNITATFSEFFPKPSNGAFFCYNGRVTNESVMVNEGNTALPYQPYSLNLPTHEKTSTGWKDIPTHIMTANGWQGELTSQSPLEFRATGQSLLDWRIDGASGGVGDWDETAQRYKIPVTVNGVTTNIFTDHQLMDGDSIDFATDQTAIPIATGNNILTVDTAVQPKSVFVKFEG